MKGVEIGEERLQAVKEALGIDFQGKVGKLSLGMRERVSLATALLSAPAAILVDEAFSNLHEREEFIAAYRKLTTDAGIDVVFSTQDESDGRLAEHLYVHGGREGDEEVLRRSDLLGLRPELVAAPYADPSPWGVGDYLLGAALWALHRRLGRAHGDAVLLSHLVYRLCVSVTM